MLSDLRLQKFIIEDLWDEAERQVLAAGSRPVRWYFSEEQAADHIRELFKGDAVRGHIDIVYAPMPESAR